jgi:hypothetical protein
MKLSSTKLNSITCRETARRALRSRAFQVIAGLIVTACLTGQPAPAQDDWAFRPPTSTGPAVGQRIPAFRASDQNGRIRDFSSIKGPKGAALYFVRSVDW